MPTERDFEEASEDSAAVREAGHDAERDAAHKQAEIEKETRRHHLDEG